ncbi:ankyrin repeat-containing protein [Tieghemostelium lacteum]|uniref:Ankyrin repeat-containing protein n=1 Tax=Tieghemostelium lacteum TaxID=361077 RepID=A0A151ZIJ4_TIELA|nr:ankyrin repeat-containing protein [Tieghemostelium lacteum]|eukprot:KYQ93818.1 ankyrin repeat-containing protein [Tieghemostelium lacteum]
MDSLSNETLFLILKQLFIRDINSFSQVSHSYYQLVTSNDQLWKRLFQIRYPNYISKNPNPFKGWRHLYKTKVLIEIGSKLPSYIEKQDYTNIEKLLGYRLKYNLKLYRLSAIAAINIGDAGLLERLLEHCKDSQHNICKNLILKSIGNGSVECTRVLIGHGADITCSNTGVLLFGSHNRVYTLGGYLENSNSSFRRLIKHNSEISYILLDSMLTQMTFFLCVYSGNSEYTLEEILQTKRGQTLVNLRTGIWDYGSEVFQLSDLVIGYRNSMYMTYNYNYLQNQSTQNDQDRKLQKEKYLSMVKVKLTQFQMIEKSLFQLASKWKPEWSSFTPIHWAALGSHLGNLKALIKYGANIKTLTRDNKSVLDILRENPNENTPQCIQFVEKLMDQSPLDKFKLEPVHSLMKSCDSVNIIGSINSLIHNGSGQRLDEEGVFNLFLSAIKYDRTVVIESLIQLLPPPPKCPYDKDGNTLIHFASAFGRPGCLMILIDRGFSVNVLNKMRQTPLMLATMNGNQEIVSILLKSYAMVDYRDYRLNTALHYAVQNQAPIAIIELLLFSGFADPISHNILWKTPIHLISENKQITVKEKYEILKLLLSSDKKEHVTDIEGNTYLHSLLNPHYSNPEDNQIIMELFAQNGLSDYSITNSHGVNVASLLKLSKFQNDRVKLESELSNFIITNSEAVNKGDLNYLSKLIFKLDYQLPLKELKLFLDFSKGYHLLQETVFYLYINIYSDLLQSNTNTPSFKESIEKLILFSNNSNFHLLNLVLNYLQLSQLDNIFYIFEKFKNLMSSIIEDQIISYLIRSQFVAVDILNRFQKICPKMVSFENFQNVLVFDNVHYLKWLLEYLHYSSQQLKSIFQQSIQCNSLKCCQYLASLLFKINTDTQSSTENDIECMVKKLTSKSCKEFVKILNGFEVDLSYYIINSEPMELASHKLRMATETVEYTTPPIHPSSDDLLFMHTPPLEKTVDITILSPTTTLLKSILCAECNFMVQDLEDHKMVCLVGKYYQCTNALNGYTNCQGLMTKNQLLNHLHSECPYLQCFYCLEYFTKVEFQEHIYQHESETWESCVLCSHSIQGLRTTYRDEIIHITNWNPSSHKPLATSESLHLSKCKNHQIQCPSCKTSFNHQELSEHKCPYRINRKVINK